MERAKISIVIVDDNLEFCDVFRDCLVEEEDMIVAGIARNGIEALNLIEEKKPDLVVLDIIMPHLDGLEVLEKLQSSRTQSVPRVLVLSALGQNEIIQRAIDTGADYYVVKPFDLEVILERIRQLFNNLLLNNNNKADSHGEKGKIEHLCAISNKYEMDVKISTVFHEIGIPAHIKGYIYLREAIIMLASNNKIMTSTLGKLYSMIGEKFNTTSNSVEGAIRHAIKIAWQRGSSETINNLFGDSVYGSNVRPTNSRFIEIIIDKLILKNKVS